MRNKYLEFIYFRAPDLPYEKVVAYTQTTAHYLESINLKKELKRKIFAYFGHIMNDGDGNEMDISKKEIAMDIITIIEQTL